MSEIAKAHMTREQIKALERFDAPVTLQTEVATHQAKDMNRNPEGKGGFAERKHDISPGGWKKENTISYQYNRFINMSPQQFKDFAKSPDDDKTMAMVLAFKRVLEARNSLPDMKELTDRTEGKAVQQIEMKAEIHSVDSILD